MGGVKRGIINEVKQKGGHSDPLERFVRQLDLCDKQVHGYSDHCAPLGNRGS